MTKDEALKMAIAEIEGWIDHAYGHTPEECADNKAIQACKDALETPECNTHPKAPHGFNRNASHSAGRYVCECEGWQLEWQGLSDEEIDKLYADWERGQTDYLNYARAIEQALKEKNAVS